MSSSRIDALTQWAAQHHGLDSATIRLSAAGGDASFRRYFRLTLPDGNTQVVMDAPPAQEDSEHMEHDAALGNDAGESTGVPVLGPVAKAPPIPRPLPSPKGAMEDER